MACHVLASCVVLDRWCEDLCVYYNIYIVGVLIQYNILAVHVQVAVEPLLVDPTEELGNLCEQRELRVRVPTSSDEESETETQSEEIVLEKQNTEPVVVDLAIYMNSAHHCYMSLNYFIKHYRIGVLCLWMYTCL